MCSIPPPPLFWRIPINLKIPEIELFLKKSFCSFGNKLRRIFLYIFIFPKKPPMIVQFIKVGGVRRSIWNSLKLIPPSHPPRYEGGKNVTEIWKVCRKRERDSIKPLSRLPPTEKIFLGQATKTGITNIFQFPKKKKCWMMTCNLGEFVSATGGGYISS